MRGVLGGLMMGCGILVAGLSGLCTLVLIGSMFVDSGSSGEDYGIGVMVLIVGGGPFLVGLGAFFAGRYLVRSQDREQPTAYSNRPVGPLDPSRMAHPDPNRERSEPD
jgi:hypothetical protein